jgi:hypothetical protein
MARVLGYLESENRPNMDVNETYEWYPQESDSRGIHSKRDSKC